MCLVLALLEMRVLFEGGPLYEEIWEIQSFDQHIFSIIFPKILNIIAVFLLLKLQTPKDITEHVFQSLDSSSTLGRNKKLMDRYLIHYQKSWSISF